MADAEELRGRRLYDALILLKPAGLAETEWAAKAGINRGFFTNIKSSDISPRSDTLRKLLRFAGRDEADLYRAAAGHAPAKVGVSGDGDPGGVPMVGIRHADAQFGLGAVFADEAPQIEVLQFPRPWVESITYTPAELLSWVRARGTSMSPTINDGDMILLDHSERKVQDQDELWAYTVGDTRGIKRLRVKGDRFQILSDNPAVPTDEEPIDFVNVIGRVVFIGRRT